MPVLKLVVTDSEIIRQALFDSITLKEQYLTQVEEDFGGNDPIYKKMEKTTNKEIKKIKTILKANWGI